MYKSKIEIIVSLLLISIVILAGCGRKDNDNNEVTDSNEERVTVSGSTSVGPLMEKEAEKFKENNKGISVEINQLGSSAGIKDAINGTVQIGMTSRDLKDEEKAEGIIEVEIAYDGIAIITNPNNKVGSLTISQVKDIYTGKITNWSKLGGEDSEIVVVSREDGSGTRDAFQEIIDYSSEDLIKNALIGDGSGNIKTTVAGNENAIGFISFEYVDDTIKALNIEDVEATPENVKNSSYKISRPFILVYKEENLEESGNKLIDFILSEEGQNIVEQNGLITIK